jgi:hypothetical protein
MVKTKNLEVKGKCAHKVLGKDIEMKIKAIGRRVECSCNKIK